MRTLLLSALAAVIGPAATLTAQDQHERVSGTIHFEDGTVQSFVDVQYIEAGGDRNTGLKVPLRDQDRYVPYTQLTSLEILRYRLGRCYSRSACLFDVEARITTTTGIDEVASYGLIGGLQVLVVDESTGEEKELSSRFAAIVDSDMVLAIRRIEFDSR